MNEIEQVWGRCVGRCGGVSLSTPVSEITLRTTGDRSFLIGGLNSAIFDLLDELSESDDLDSISISISILEKKNNFDASRVRTAFRTAPTFLGTNYLG